MNVLVDDTVGLLLRTLGGQLEIAMVLAHDLWPVLADPVQLESAFANLAINARDDTPQGGHLATKTANKELYYDYDRKGRVNGRGVQVGGGLAELVVVQTKKQ